MLAGVDLWANFIRPVGHRKGGQGDGRVEIQRPKIKSENFAVLQADWGALKVSIRGAVPKVQIRGAKKPQQPRC